MKEDNGAMQHLDKETAGEVLPTLSSNFKKMNSTLLGVKDTLVKIHTDNAKAKDMVRNDDNDDAKFKKGLFGAFGKVEKLLGEIKDKGFFGALLAGLGALLSKLTGGLKNLLFGFGKFLIGPIIGLLKGLGGIIIKGINKLFGGKWKMPEMIAEQEEKPIGQPQPQGQLQKVAKTPEMIDEQKSRINAKLDQRAKNAKLTRDTDKFNAKAAKDFEKNRLKNLTSQQRFDERITKMAEANKSHAAKRMAKDAEREAIKASRAMSPKIPLGVKAKKALLKDRHLPEFLTKERKISKFITKEPGVITNIGKKGFGAIAKSTPGKIVGKGLKAASKPVAAIVEKAGVKVAESTVGKLAIKGATKAALKMGLTATAGAAQTVPIVGQIIGAAIMVGFAASDAISAWNDAADILGKGDIDPAEITVTDKLKAAALGAISGLMFGIISPKDIYNLITSDFNDPEVTKGISTSIGNWFNNIGDALMDFGANFDIGEIIDSFSKKVQDMIEGFSVTFKGTIVPMLSAIISNPETWIGIGKTILGALMTIGNVVIQAFKAVFWSIPNAILDIAGSITATILMTLGDVVKSIGDGLGELMYNVLSKVPFAAKILGLTPIPDVDKKDKEKEKTEKKLLKDRVEQQKVEQKLLEDKKKQSAKDITNKNGGASAPAKTVESKNGEAPKPAQVSQTEKENAQVRAKKKAAEDKVTAENKFDIQTEIAKNTGGTSEQQMAQVFMNFLLSTFAPAQAELIAAAEKGGDAMKSVPLRIVNPLT